MWVNRAAETGLPYDIECCHPARPAVYVEVKATSTSTKSNFEVSTAELEFACAHNEQYAILRVFNVGSSWAACHFDLIKQPWSLLQGKGAKLFMQI